ncbi:E3 ubiquitin-protein ligase RNF8-like [Asterias rubens]|uniref:E3 ubiquitin-protein ligase RNF8-like n=1 Tax=Asterias rubens TaxID=7604 RepID=UPI001455805F|nr:E3 ubiquitin-protein ligase RNF8-like [Asterias rubens]
MAGGCEWCLKRFNSQSRKYSVIPLKAGTEVTIGRGLDVTVQLLSRRNQLMLSRKHAIFKETENGNWAVIDNKSLNGVHVNSSRITALRPHVLQSGDTIQLGVVADGETQAEFVFNLTRQSYSDEEVSQILGSYKASKDRGNIARVESRKESQDSEPIACRRTNVNRNDSVLQNRTDLEEKKRKIGTCSQTNVDRNDRPGTSGLPLPKRTKLASTTELELSARLAEQKRVAERKAAEAEQQFNELSRMLAEQQAARELLEEQLKQRELDINREMESEKEELENKKKQLQEEMEKALMLQVQQKELDLQEQLKMQQDALTEEKLTLEKKLKAEWEKRLQDQEKVLKKIQADMQSTHEAQVQEKEATMMEQLKYQREELLKEKQRLELSLQEEWNKKLEEKDKSLGKMQEELRTTLEEEIRKKEEMMLQQLQTQRESLQADKAKVEESLQKEMERKLEEKDKDLQAGLENEKTKLEEVIALKEREYAQLHTELMASRLEKEEHEICIQKAKEEALQNITDVMENELQCSVCAELFIQATTLNCSHSFCQYCILSWMKRKKECPVCRASITSHSRSIVLDNYIDKMVESLSEDMKQKRKEVVTERKSLTVGPASGTRSHDYGPIEISSDYDDSDNSVDEDDEDDSINTDYDPGIDGEYYGGGTCHICGRRGHWARGCPY